MKASGGRPRRRTAARGSNRRRPSQRGAALAALLLSALSADAFSTGPPQQQQPASVTARVRTHTRSRTAQHSQHGAGGVKSSLSSATVAEAPSSMSSSERRSGRRSDAAIRAGIKRRSSICGSESRAHRFGGDVSYLDCVLGSSSSPLLTSYGSISTRRSYFEGDGVAAVVGNRPVASNAASTTRKSRHVSTGIPPWLAQLSNPERMRGEVRDNLFNLRRYMSERSNLSSAEVHAVTHALEAAAQGSLAHLSGAIEFCSLLVETMEMGRDALVAAAFHYCGCVRAREAQAEAEERGEGEWRSVVTGMAQPPAGEFDAAYLCTLAGSGIESYGAGTTKIAMDAARLKGTEAVAAAVSEARGHCRMTHEEADNLRSLILSNDASGEWRALAIRCAACLYRLRGLQSFRTEHTKQFKPSSPSREEITVGREALHIYAPLAHRLGMHKLKSELEGAAFQALYKRQHRTVTSLLQDSSDGSSISPRGVPMPHNKAKASSSPFFFAEDALQDWHCQQQQHADEEDDESIRFGMRSVLDDVTYQVKRMLHEDSHLMDNVSTVKVAARIKEPYSLWRKLLRTHWKKINEEQAKGTAQKGIIRPLSVLDVHDAIALRVILTARKLSASETDGETSLREHDLCYHVQSLCSSQLGPPQREVKDYVRHPKPNGYQSLHYSSRVRWHGEDWPFEVQIRSGDMHRVAEFGLAAHWEYKARTTGGASSSASSSSANPLLFYQDASSDEDTEAQAQGEAQAQARSATAVQEDMEPHDSLLFATVSESEDPRSYTHTLRAERARARAERLAPYIEALSAARSNLARARVFVFLNAGGSYGGSESIVSLPKGARVLDALREEERRTGAELGLARGDRESAAAPWDWGPDRLSVLRNGSLTGMTQRLENGDVLTFFARPPSSA